MDHKHTLPLGAHILAAVITAFGVLLSTVAHADSPSQTPSGPGFPSTPGNPANSQSAPPSARISPYTSSQPSAAPANPYQPTNPYASSPSAAQPANPAAPYDQRSTDPGPASRGGAYDVRPLYPR